MKRRARRPPEHVSAPAGGLPRRLVASASRSDAGAVTAEFASVLPLVMVIVILMFALTRGMMVSMTCQDAASAAARAAVSAGGDSASEDAARTVAGEGVSVRITHNGDTVSVVVHCPVVPDPTGVLPTKVKGEAMGVVT